MDAQDYRMEAGLFSKGESARNKSLVFRRFRHAEDAICYAVEELSPKILASCSLEVNGLHYFGREIRPLYDSEAFPLRRRSKMATEGLSGLAFLVSAPGPAFAGRTHEYAAR